MNDTRKGKHWPQRRRPPPGRNTAPRPRQNASSGNTYRNYGRYMALARESTTNGDIIEAENCYQHAEHYFRVTRES